MSEIALAKINSFASVAEQADVSPEEPIFVLSSSQLQEIITRATQEATELILQELQDLHQEIQHLKDTKPGITALRVDDCFEAIEQIDQHLARIDRTRPSAPGKKIEQKLERLDFLLLSSSGPVSFSEIGKKLELGSRDSRTGKTSRRQAMTKLRETLETMSDRYIIHKARRGNAKFVSLVPAYAQHLSRANQV